MRRGVSFALVATLALTAFALWRPRVPPVVNAFNRDLEARTMPLPETPRRAKPGVPPQLPQEWPRPEFEPPHRDPFAPVLPPPVKVAAAPMPAPAPVAPPAVAPPSPPPANYRFLGRLTTPEGERLVYLASNSGVHLVRPGHRFDDGYVVESVTRDSVLLAYPALDAKVAIPLPVEPGS